ncbi:type VII toxin-antitoxin system MntA family adenylyltransferase antitoxin [Egbenema bharatensis]|uniref:type VII toxin-antitoxin system MntA family adenylyltransferase antitoxin n=1 Tax=Egbenema bharatensis TaxID=3463334 RepID=UPI003A849269
MYEIDALKSASERFSRVHPSLKLIVLFGSRARGDDDRSSDWDFAFLSESTLNHKSKSFWFSGAALMDTLSHLAGISYDDIDLVDLSRCSEVLAHFIARDGLLIYEKTPGEFAQFQRRALKTQAELEEFRHSQREQVLQALQRWGV